MRRTLSDWLVLALDRGFGPRPAAGTQLPPAAKLVRPSAAPDEASLSIAPGEGQPAFARGAEPVIWLCAADPAAGKALGSVARHLMARFPGFRVLVTPSEAHHGPGPERAAIAGFLDAVRPAAAVITCSPWWPALTTQLHRRGIPVFGAMLRLPDGHWLEHRLARPLARRQLDPYHALMTQDAASLAQLSRLGLRPGLASVGGGLADPVTVPPGNASEQQSLTELMRGRPIWCAASLPLAELPLIAAAQRSAQRRSHRLLLVVVPERIEDAPAIHAGLNAAGLIPGLRSSGEDPVDDLSAYVADLEGEIGLWLRLAPVSFMGGTLTAGAPSRSPIEAAALGSAVLHGPETTPHSEAYARLSAAGAARPIREAEALATEIDRLSAPEQAALMAHAGWEVASAGDEAAEALVAAMAGLLDHISAEGALPPDPATSGRIGTGGAQP